MADLTTTGLATRVDQLLTRVDQLLLGRVLTATQQYQTETADADPGAGNFRLNNATLANVTEGYFDDEDSAGTSIAALIDTYDDSASTTKGTLVLTSLDNADRWAAFRITGTVVDATGYRKITLSHIVSSGTWEAGELFAQAFYRAGDVGSANTLSIGTVSEGTAGATITGSAPNQTLNLTIPKGDQGEQGPPVDLEIGLVETLAAGEDATATLLGTAPNFVLNLGLPTGATGSQGPRGYSILSGSETPDEAVGSNGDFYIKDPSGSPIFYGPKAYDAWPAGIALKGPTGATGATGADGATILSGTVAPAAGVGEEDDFYINTLTFEIYGPKTASGWGTPTSLVGPTGPSSGDVVGPATSVGDQLVAFSGTTGKLIKSAGTSVAGLQASIDARTGKSTVRTEAFTFATLAPIQLIDTSGGAFTGTLPASPAVGARIEFADADDFSANNFTIGRNGELIEGASEDCVISRQGASGGFVFVGGSTGWKAFK